MTQPGREQRCERGGCRYPAKYRAVFDPRDMATGVGEVRLLCGVHGNYRLASDGWKMTSLASSRDQTTN